MCMRRLTPVITFVIIPLILCSEAKQKWINANVVRGYSALQNNENAPEFDTKNYDIMLNYMSIIA